MGNYSLTIAASDDMAGLYKRGILTFGLHAADAYYDGLHAQLSLLAEHPFMGVSCESLLAGARKFIYRSHVIYFLQEGAGILVVRILRKEARAEGYL